MSNSNSAQATLTVEAIVEAIESARERLEVCVPDRDYYARNDDWSREIIEFINPNALIAALGKLA